MSPLDLHRTAGSLAEDGDPVALSPERAGWRYAGLRVMVLQEGEERVIRTGDMEMAVLPLSTGCRVEVEGRTFELEGRRSVFDRVTDFAYLPREAEATVTASSAGEIALPSAPARRRLEARYGPAEEVPVEVRGAGQCTRQITNFLEPSAFPADRLVAVEVLTPAGNWSSYPPHKHDTADPSCGEAELEEIYYFRVAEQARPAAGGPHRPSTTEPGFAVHRTYGSEGDFDITVTVRDGDVFLIPRGYHGPSMAAPGFDLYYLNVLAGPAEERTMAYCDDPAYGWIRDSWADEKPDPRLPMTDAKGRRSESAPGG